MKRCTSVIIARVAAICVAILAMIVDVQCKYANKIIHLSSSAQLPNDMHAAAIILGAGVLPGGRPSFALKDRMDAALKLYASHEIGKLFVTGDDGKYHEDEIDVMTSYLLTHGASSTDIVVDSTGYRTYESCKHAKEAGIQHAVVVTQRFHIGRALYLCNELGVQSVGLDADIEQYGNPLYLFWTRDLLASVKAWWDINVWPPKPPISA
jgi:vancomycin permeability regulator SanA